MISRLRLLFLMFSLYRDGLVTYRKGWKLTPRGRLYAEDIVRAELIVQELSR